MISASRPSKNEITMGRGAQLASGSPSQMVRGNEGSINTEACSAFPQKHLLAREAKVFFF